MGIKLPGQQDDNQRQQIIDVIFLNEEEKQNDLYDVYTKITE